MVQQIRTAENYQLKCDTDNASPIPLIGSVDWYKWLDQQQTFSFEAEQGSFIARKEKRSSGTYWYAYHSKNGKIYVAYLGKSEKITFEKLYTTLSRLHEKAGRAENASSQEEQAAVVGNWSEQALILTRMCIPRMHRSIISRPSLLERLNEGMCRKLTLISASAGFGKTVLLSDWATRSPWAVAWVSLDRSSNDPTHFWHYLITALGKIHAHIDERILMLLHSSQQVRTESILTMLINNLVQVSEDFALILDEYDVIHSAEVHQSMTFLLDHLPPCMHVFIASRVSPPLALTRLRAQRQLLELRTADLRFTDEEISAFFSQSLGIPLSSETLTLLASRTEGWVTGLELIALSSQKHKDILEFTRTLSQYETYIYEYLANEILQQQPEEIQRFLLETSLLDRLSGPLCDALTNRNDSQSLLEQLEKKNMFIVSLDEQKCWYRYHHIFRCFLEKNVRQQDHYRIDDLYRRAAEWHEKADLKQEAVEYALMGNNFQKAALLISQIGQELLQQNKLTTLLEWLQAMPEEIIRSFPYLCLYRAWLFLTAGAIQSAGVWLRHAQACLESLPQSTSQKERRDVQGSIAALYAHLLAFRGNIPHIVNYARQALSCLSKRNTYFRSISAINLGVAYWLSNKIQLAINAFGQAKKMGYVSNNIYIVLTALCCQAHVLTIQGRLRRALRSTQQALQLISEQHCDLLWAAADAYICTGQLFYEWDEQEIATFYVEKGLTLSKQAGYKDMLAYGSTVLAKIKQAQGDIDQAIHIMEQEEYFRGENRHSSWIITLMDTARIRLALLQGDTERIKRWRDQAQSRGGYMNTFEKLTLIRIHIANKELDKASSIIEQDLAAIDSDEQKAKTIEIFLLKALIAYHQQSLDSAIAFLEHALELAEPEGYIRLLASEGPPLAALLEELLIRKQKSQHALSSSRLQYIQKLLGACGQKPEKLERLASDLSREAEKFTHMLLNKREQEVMQLLVAGMSNREISEKLFISENTVKWYIKGIYSKIGVHNRAQAVAWASKLPRLASRENLLNQ